MILNRPSAGTKNEQMHDSGPALWIAGVLVYTSLRERAVENMGARREEAGSEFLDVFREAVMPQAGLIVRALIASPADVVRERTAIPEVIGGWNASHSFQRAVIIERASGRATRHQ